MLKHILASTALATLLASGAYAQTDPATDPAVDPAAPVEGAEGAAEPMTEPTSPDVVEDDTAEPAAPDVAEDETAEPAAPDVAEDEAAEPATPEVVQETTEPSAPVVAEDPAAVEDTDAMAAEEPMEMDSDADAMADDAVDPAAGEGMMAEGDWVPIDLATFSADRLIGADIVTANDETVASIEDVLLSDDGNVDNIVAKFGGFLGFGANRVLLEMDEIEVLQDPNENLLVRTSLTPESIEGRPEYEE